MELCADLTDAQKNCAMFVDKWPLIWLITLLLGKIFVELCADLMDAQKNYAKQQAILLMICSCNFKVMFDYDIIRIKIKKIHYKVVMLCIIFENIPRSTKLKFGCEKYHRLIKKQLRNEGYTTVLTRIYWNYIHKWLLIWVIKNFTYSIIYLMSMCK